MGRKQVESVLDLPVGTSIWIFWDEDQTFYKGEVGHFSDDGRVMTVLYPENEEQENIDVEDFDNKTILYTLEDPSTEQLLIPEARGGRVTQSGNPLIQQLRKLGKVMHDIEDRLPVEGLVTTCDAVWQTWSTTVATAKTVEELAMMLLFLSQEMKPNVTTDWWSKESKYWRILVSLVRSPEALEDLITELSTQAINWEGARRFFPAPAEPLPEGTHPPTPRKHRVTLLEPRKKRRFESMKPGGLDRIVQAKQNANLKKKLKIDKKLRIQEKKLLKKKRPRDEGEEVERPKKKLKKKSEGGGKVKKVKKVVQTPRTPLVMPVLPPLGEKLSAEGLDAKDGVAPATVAVTCNNIQGEYIPAQHMVACRCPQCGVAGKLLTCQQFEAHTGSRAKKWKETIRLAAVPGTRLSEWLAMMERKGIRGVAFTAIEQKRVKALTTSEGGLSRPQSAKSEVDAARARKAVAAKLEKAKTDIKAEVAPSAVKSPLDLPVRGDPATQGASVVQLLDRQGDNPIEGGSGITSNEVTAPKQEANFEAFMLGGRQTEASETERREESPGDDPTNWFT